MTKDHKMEVFENYESSVRSYSRSFPTVFQKAKDYKIWDTEGSEYIDFFAGAGALNYGHNNEQMKEKLIDYISEDGISHSLDMGSTARADFLNQFNDVILKPRGMDYRVMFPGPTGTNTVESALKVARKVTGRDQIIGFTNGFHGMTIGSLAVTGNAMKRKGAGIPLSHAVSMPYDQYLEAADSINYIDQFLQDSGSGVDLPAAVILETVQGEGGINPASAKWLKGIEKLCRKYGMLLIVDDVQAGCGRTGTFFSFEQAGIEPDVICLSKSISGYGLPMALTLIKPQYDQWTPGEHNGTFRGNNMAFITAMEALNFWKDDALSQDIQEKADIIESHLTRFAKSYPALEAQQRGRGFMQGLACGVPEYASKICEAAFENGLIMETSGPKDEVAKLLPPLIIDEEGLLEGLKIMETSIQQVLNK
ncbi:diaminobutyrate--2-oxoglutarate transaminase [Tuberibacillus sp. Marseille-P3662]|uniref:diaminobutyrate--2-oxoglutarate transaminase n=1 Tax=Tuberibacillus sp. Marseille-P3662 TaxID=1965358 RepID=UPI003F8F2F17